MISHICINLDTKHFYLIKSVYFSNFFLNRDLHVKILLFYFKSRVLGIQQHTVQCGYSTKVQIYQKPEPSKSRNDDEITLEIKL